MIGTINQVQWKITAVDSDVHQGTTAPADSVVNHTTYQAYSKATVTINVIMGGTTVAIQLQGITVPIYTYKV